MLVNCSIMYKINLFHYLVYGVVFQLSEENVNANQRFEIHVSHKHLGLS